MESIVIESRIWINAPINRVWEAITTADQIRQWWGNGDYWEIAKLEVGGIIKFGDPDDLMIATIDKVDPPYQFSIRWPPQEQFHSINMYTVYLLEAENGGTRVTVRETGLEALPEELRQKRMESTAKGYETVLAGLKAFVER